MSDGFDWRRAGKRTALLIASIAVTMCGRRAVLEADDARHIVEEVQKRTTTSSERYDGVLSTSGKDHKTSEKRWSVERIGSHGSSKTVIRFTSPPEVKGVALLVVNHPDRSSDQWMWTPAIERDRRIAPQDRSTRFFGTDFSFEDLEERDVDQYDYLLEGDARTEEGISCWKIASIPKAAKSSQYSRSILWIRQTDFAVARIESYVKDQLVRRLTYSKFDRIDNIWTARELDMEDLRRGTTTRLVLENVRYNVPVSEESFTLQALRRP